MPPRPKPAQAVFKACVSAASSLSINNHGDESRRTGAARLANGPAFFRLDPPRPSRPRAAERIDSPLGSGNPRDNPASSPHAARTAVHGAPIFGPCPTIPPKRSRRTGTAISAAAVGVGARLSAT